jgi:hypothetical protein
MNDKSDCSSFGVSEALILPDRSYMMACMMNNKGCGHEMQEEKIESDRDLVLLLGVWLFSSVVSMAVE